MIPSALYKKLECSLLGGNFDIMEKMLCLASGELDANAGSHVIVWSYIRYLMSLVP